jgi:hypothetical protein
MRLPAADPRELAPVALVLALLALAVTYPLAREAPHALPGDLGDPLLNAFILGWDASRFVHGFEGLWTAPFFFPLHDTLALSEHLLGVAIFTAPLIWLTGSPVLAYNAAFLGSYVLAGLGMYLLTKRLWGRHDAAWLAALAFAFAPHRVMHVPHLQLLMSGWMPLSLWGLHGYFASGSRRALAVFAASFALLGLSNGYFLYFFAVPVAVVVFGHLLGRAIPRWRPVAGATWGRDIVHLAAAALGILVVIAPAAFAYVRVRQTLGFHRSVGEMDAFSARWPDYLRIPDSLLLWSGILRVGEGERMLFPGLTIVMLAGLAAVSIRRSVWAHGAARPVLWTWHVGLYAAILGLTVWLSAGPSAPGPYTLLLRVVPGFNGLRVPARFIVVVSLALAVLGSAGAAWLLGRLRPRVATAVAILLGSIIMAEGYGGPIWMVPFRPDQRVRADVNAWLRGRPPGGVLELPIGGPALEPFTLVYQYNTLLHRHPIVNGYSGYGYGLQDFLGGPGSPLNEPDAMAGVLLGLRMIGVRYLLVHRSAFSNRPDYGWPDPNRLVDAIDTAAGPGREGRRFNDVIAWTLGEPPSQLPIDETSLKPLPPSAFTATASAMPDRLWCAFDGNIDTKWLSAAPQAGGEWIRLSFAREVDVRRLVVLTSRNGVGDYPRGLTVESETADGSRMTLYSGPFLPRLIKGLAGTGAGAPAVLDLPSNLTRVLWLRQTGRTRTWQWAIHELEIHERRQAG